MASNASSWQWTPDVVLTLVIAVVGLGLSIFNTYREWKRTVCRFSVNVERGNIGVADPWIDHARLLLAVLVANESPEPFSVMHMTLTVGEHVVYSSQRVSRIVGEQNYQYATPSGIRVGPQEPGVQTDALPAELLPYQGKLLYVEFIFPKAFTDGAEDVLHLTVYTNRGEKAQCTQDFNMIAIQCELPQLVGIQPLDIT